MNLVNRFFLKAILLFGPLYQYMGVNRVHLQSILRTKLLMDDRRPPAIQQVKRRNFDKPVNLATLGTMAVSFFMGLCFSAAFAFGSNTTTQLTIYFSMFIFILAATLISDFTAVLIDVRDNYIILPKPVNDRTIVVSRLLHIFIHICKVVVPMTLSAFVILTMRFSLLSGIAFFGVALLATAFTIFLINALYLFILKITTPQKFQSIIVFIQIGFTIVMYASYQIVPRIMARSAYTHFNWANQYKFLAAPPFWFAGAFTWLHHFRATGPEKWASLCAVLATTASVWITIRYLAPSFNKKMAMISSTDPSARKGKLHLETANRKSISQWTSTLFTKPGAERNGYLFTWRLSNRSRDFKMKVYPNIGYLLVYLVIFFIGKKNPNHVTLQNPNVSKTFVVVSMYLLSFVLMIALQQIKYSEKYKGSWVFYVTPLNRPGEMILGSIKATMVKFYAPFFLVLSVAGIFLLGPGLLINLVFGLLNVLLLMYVMAYITHPQLPFSMPDTQTKGGNFVRTLVLMLLLAILGFVHYLLYDIWAAILVLCAMSGAGVWLMANTIKQISWNKLTRGES